MKKPTNTMRMNKYQWSGWPYILPMIKDKTAPKSTAIHTSIRITTSPFCMIDWTVEQRCPTIITPHRATSVAVPLVFLLYGLLNFLFGALFYCPYIH